MIPKANEAIVENLIQAQFMLIQLPTKENLKEALLLILIALVRIEKLVEFDGALELAIKELTEIRKVKNEL